MTEGQAASTLIAHGATYVTTKSGVEWWKLQDGGWIAKQVVAAGQVVLKKLPKGSCGC